MFLRAAAVSTAFLIGLAVAGPAMAQFFPPPPRLVAPPPIPPAGIDDQDIPTYAPPPIYGRPSPLSVAAPLSARSGASIILPSLIEQRDRTGTSPCRSSRSPP